MFLLLFYYTRGVLRIQTLNIAAKIRQLSMRLNDCLRVRRNKNSLCT